MSSLCAICRRAHRDQGDAHRTACDRCEHRIRGWLREIPRQLPLLEASLVLDGGPAQGRSAGRAHAPLPVRADVLNMLGPAAPGPVRDHRGDQSGTLPILALVYAWAEQIAAERARDIPPFRPRADYTRYIAAHLPYACTRPWITDLHTELGDVVHAARAITRTEPRRRPQDAPCPGCSAFALIAEDWQQFIECTTCGLLLSHDEYAAHHQAVMPPLYRTALRLVVHHATQTQTTPKDEPA
ncbi:hypothetical protein [Streptomyces niveus]|uniref:hypothetical protein n=1 Tax=Streptomyces niveus TaxID=193462 RepID=UPI0036D3FF8F